MTGHYKQITKGIKGFFLITLVGGLIGSCGEIRSRSQSKEYADPTTNISESPKLPYLSHQALMGLYITLTENQGLKRQINFFDYGFDGELDRIRVNQNGRREYVITNRTELCNWQLLFEKIRERRFGKYNAKEHPND